MLVEGGAAITESNNDGQVIWTRLYTNYMEPAALRSFLRVAVLLESPPADFIAGLTREHRLLITEGERIRLAVPQYLERRRAVVEAHCPLEVPPLVELVLRLSEPDAEDIWAIGLGQSR